LCVQVCDCRLLRASPTILSLNVTYQHKCACAHRRVYMWALERSQMATTTHFRFDHPAEIFLTINVFLLGFSGHRFRLQLVQPSYDLQDAKIHQKIGTKVSDPLLSGLTPTEPHAMIANTQHARGTKPVYLVSMQSDQSYPRWDPFHWSRNTG